MPRHIWKKPYKALQQRRKRMIEKPCEQYFTHVDVMRQCADIIASRVAPGVFVDTSCGRGDMGLFMHQRGFRVMMFDIDATNLAPHVRMYMDRHPQTMSFRHCSWFDVVDGIPEGAIIGFNPPFGFRATTSRKFVEHALRFRPRHFAWLTAFIVGKHGCHWRPPGFATVSSHRVTGDAFIYEGAATQQRCTMHLWRHDPALAAQQLEADQAAAKMPLPPGFSIGRLRPYVQTIDRIAVRALPKDEALIILHVCGFLTAGRSGIIYDPPSFKRVSDRSITILDNDNDMSSTQYLVIRVPPAWQGERRHELIRRIAALAPTVTDGDHPKTAINIPDTSHIIRLIAREEHVQAQP